MTSALAWQSVALRDLCEVVQYGYTASATDKPVGPKFLRITDIVPETIDWSCVPYCEIDPQKLDKYLLRRGDIVIARTGATTGYAKYIRNAPEVVFASYLVRIRLRGDVDDRYAGYVVESSDYKRFIQATWGGAAQPNANAQVLTSYEMPLPPLTTQRKIAAILSTYDDLIENNLRRIKILEEMAQTIYREWFVKFRFPGHEKARMVDSPLGKIPERWRVVSLVDVCNIVMGQSPKSEFYNTRGDGLPFHQGVTNFGPRFPTERVFCTVKNRIAETGEILLSVRAPVGRINIADKRLIVGRGLCAIHNNEGNQWFTFHQLKERFQDEDMMGGGTIFKAVTRKDVESIEFLNPANLTVQAFEEICHPIEAQTKILTEKNITLRRTRDLLLPKLISGELDVSDLDIKTGGHMQ